jgi:serine/threonine protein kinase
MTWLSDSVLDHLGQIADLPDLSGTKYDLLEKIGQGGMGSVYAVQDRDLGRQVALKVLAAVPTDEPAKARLTQEARIISRLEHPGIVPVHDCGMLPDGRIYYTMKLVRGERLDQAVRSRPGISNSLRLFEKICEAVAFAHANGVIHRDLKPQNIMVGPFGEVLVMDWGIAKLLERSTISSIAPRSAASGHDPSSPATSDGVVVGTPGYMAPEQAQGGVESVGASSDIYALGALLYFLLTHRDPASSGPDREVRPRTLNRSIPRPLEAICQRAMAPNAQQRYQNISLLADDIARFLANERVSAYAEGPLGTAWRLAVKYRAAIILVVAYLVIRIILLFWLGT